MITYLGLEVLFPIIQAFRAQGLQLFLVGGSIRDLLMGKIPKDLDLATDALPEQTQAIMEKIGATIIAKLGGNFGTVHTLWKGQPIEITTFRANESYQKGSRRPTVNFSTDLSQDLLRRDFTCNAIAADLMLLSPNCTFTVSEDPTSFQGRVDLAEHLLGTPQDPIVSFTDDPLRILRGYRFRGKLDFSFYPNIRPAIRQTATLLKEVSWERILEEILQIAATPIAATLFREMMEDGVLTYVLPEIINQLGFDQDNYHHHLPLWEHTLDVVKHAVELGGLPTTVLAALLHDITKPITWQSCYQCPECGMKLRMAFSKHPQLTGPCSTPGCSSQVATYLNRSFKGHDQTGAELAKVICDRWKMSRADQEDISKMIAEHQNWSRLDFDKKAARKFVNLFGDLYPQMLILLRADRMGHAPGHNLTEPYDKLEQLISELDTQKVINIKPPIDGHQVMAFTGLAPSPELGKIMKALQEATVLGEVTSDNEAFAFVRLFRAATTWT